MLPLVAPDPSELLFNRRIKINPRNGQIIEDVVASKAIFNPSGAVRLDERPLRGRSSAATDADGAQRAARRAKKQLYEYALCNDFDLFFTLTLSPERIDRYDYKAAVRKFGQWADNRVRRKGFRYVAVPELHKDGAIHFHGLCCSNSCKLLDSGHKDKGHTIYNIADWRLGYTTAMRLYGEPQAAAHYIAKYISKQQGTNGTIGGRYFFHGGRLDKPIEKYYHEEYKEAELLQRGKLITIDAAGLSLCYLA